MQHELEPVVAMAEKMRACACLIDSAKYNRLGLMVEAFVDLIERECHQHMQADAQSSERADFAVNVPEKHSEHRQYVRGCDRCEDLLDEAREVEREMLS